MANALLNGKDVQSEQIKKLRTLINASPDVICSFDAEGRFLSASKACYCIWGYTEEELLGNNYLDYVVEEDKAKSLEAGDKIRSGINFTNFENRCIRKDGSVVPIMWSATWDESRKIMFCVARDATEKKKAEQQARENEDRLYRAYRLSQLGWWEWDLLNNKYYASDELYMIYGFTREECPEISIEKFLSHVHPANREKVKQDIALVDVRTIYEYSHWFIKPSGDLICLMHHVRVHRDEKGEIILINGTTRDITQKRKAKIALKKSKRKLQNILESIQDSFFVLDKNWKVTYWNKKAEQVLGRKAESLIGKVIWDEFKGSILLKSYNHYQRAMKEQVAVHFEDCSPRLNRWFEANAYPSPEGLSVYFRDITERKEQEKQLKISNERYQFVAMASTDVVFDWDIITGDIYINDAFEKIFGFSAEPQEIFQVWETLLHDNDKHQVISSLQEAMQNPTIFRWKQHYRIVRRDGSIAYLSARSVLVRNDQGEAIRMVGSVRDITAVRVREEKEKQLQLRYKLLFHDSPTPKWIFDPKTLRFVEVNEAASRLYGYSRDEWLKMTILDLRKETECKKVAKMYEGAIKDPEFQCNGVAKHRKKNGEWIDVELTSHALKQENTCHIVTVGNDITEKLETQKKLARAIINTQEKERSVIGKELHDNVNQLLTTAKLYVQNASYYPEQKEHFLTKGADIIQKSINEIRALSKALITPTLSDIGFKETLDELVDYYKELNLFKVDFSYLLKTDELEHELKLSIYRILQELFNNTIKYAKAKNVMVQIHETEQYLRVIYIDDGVGFDQKQYKRGLGLNNIKNRIEVFKGKLRLITEPGKGTTALVVFPYVKK